jgi:hypothetical protein
MKCANWNPGEKSEIHGKKLKINVMFWRMKKRLL